jgi:hypothetical protein
MPWDITIETIADHLDYIAKLCKVITSGVE